MTFLPIVDRELRVASRKRTTYWMRLAAAIVAMVFCFGMIAFTKSWRVQRLGPDLFNTLSIIGFIYALGGAIFTADSLSGERREGTLGLLFLTDLKSLDVVFGKIVSNSLTAVYGLIAILPVLALPILMGGVTGAEFWRMVLVLLTTLMFSLSIGVCISVFNRDEWKSLVTSLMIVGIFTGLLPALWGMHFRLLKNSFVDHFFLLPSAGYAFQKAYDNYYRATGGADEFWFSIGTLWALNLVFLVGACIVLPRIWQAKGERVRKPWFARSKQHRVSNLLNESPFLWLCVRQRGLVIFAWILFVLGMIPWCWYAYKSVEKGKLDWEFAIVVYGSFFLHLFTKAFVAVAACRTLHEERRSGSLELLLVTPLRVRSILTAQRLAVWRQFLWCSIILAISNVAMAAIEVAHDDNSDVKTAVVVVMIGGMISLFADVYAITSVGMWRAINSRRFGFAVFGTLGRVLLPPWALVFLFFLAMMRGSGDALAAFTFIYFFITIGYSVFIARIADLNLERELRAIAAGLKKPVPRSRYIQLDNFAPSEAATE